MAQYDYAVFIGRMQPPHAEHINQIIRALNIADKVIVALGSHRAAPNIKNPWTTDEREQMIRRALGGHGTGGRLEFVKVRDYYYNNTAWFTDLHNSVMNAIDKENPSICVVGCNKDESSWYLEALPESWKRELSLPRNLMSATTTRDLYFQGNMEFTDLHPNVSQFLKEWSETSLYKNLVEEWKFISEYKKMWAMAPYPVTFVTTDAVVVKNGHVLVVRRKFNPGKGLLALPGGFVNQNESIVDSAFRELKEETRILMPQDVLKKHIVEVKVFDHPDRSLRGRTITHGFCIKLPDGGQLPQVKGSDDAERAVWMPIAELGIRENEFFEDHLHIISYFVNKL